MRPRPAIRRPSRSTPATTFLLDRVSACTNNANCTTTPGTLNTGTVIQGSSTLQVKFVTGNPGQQYCARGLSAFPRGFWTTDYYAPLDHTTTAGRGETDYYLHNPNGADITVTWASRTASGSFTIPARTTVSYRDEVGAVPVDSGLYFKGTDVFWGVGIADSLANAYEWGFSLLPSTFLFKEHYLGWAPGYASWLGTGDASNYNDVGVFLTVAQDNTRVFVDLDNDGTVDQTYTLDRLQTQYVSDPNDGSLSQAHIWATGDFTMAYGENGDTAEASNPSLDLGYIAIPGTDFMSLVLGVTKTASPQVVATASGSTTKFTIDVESQKYAVDSVSVVDLLPPNWAYTPGTTTITLPDLTTLTGAAAEPVTLPTYADFFNAVSYANNDSTPTGTAWTTNWIEESESNGTGTDNVRVLNDGDVTPNVNALRFTNSGATNGRALARMADLSSFPGGVLEFAYRRESTDNFGDRLDVQVCANATSGIAPAGITCAGGWVSAPAVLGPGTDAAYQTYSVDLKTLLPTNWDSTNVRGPLLHEGRQRPRKQRLHLGRRRAHRVEAKRDHRLARVDPGEHGAKPADSNRVLGGDDHRSCPRHAQPQRGQRHGHANPGLARGHADLHRHGLRVRRNRQRADHQDLHRGHAAVSGGHLQLHRRGDERGVDRDPHGRQPLRRSSRRRDRRGRHHHSQPVDGGRRVRLAGLHPERGDAAAGGPTGPRLATSAAGLAQWLADAGGHPGHHGRRAAARQLQ